MMRNRKSVLPVLVSLAALAYGGCVLREETITISRDGAVLIELEITGSEEELAGGDAMPSARSGWDVQRRIEQDEDEEKIVLTSSRRFEPSELLPRTFAAADDPDADLYLDFPTSVRMERRGESLYFYFRRTYTRRDWTYVKYWEDVFIDDRIEKLGDKPLEELNRADRVELVQALTAVEVFKQIELAQAAFSKCAFDLPPEAWLTARQAMLTSYEEGNLVPDAQQSKVFEDGVHYSTPVDGIIDRCGPLAEEERMECFTVEVERMLDRGFETLVDSLEQNAWVTRRQIVRFEEAFDRSRRRHSVTEVLGTHNFEIVVNMPGTLVAHNGDHDDFDKDRGLSKVSWNFDGNAFRDRVQELVAVSRLDLSEVDGRLDPLKDSDR